MSSTGLKSFNSSILATALPLISNYVDDDSERLRVMLRRAVRNYPNDKNIDGQLRINVDFANALNLPTHRFVLGYSLYAFKF
jgi:hypothetical protein